MDTVENPGDLPKKIKKPKKEKTPEQILEKEKKKEKKKERRKDLSELAFERIRAGFERLQIAWMKAAVTFIALGFTAYKFYVGKVEQQGHPIMKYANGRWIGMFMMLVGFLGLLQATIIHIKNYSRIKKHYPELSYSVSLIQTYFILVLNLFLILMLIFKA